MINFCLYLTLLQVSHFQVLEELTSSSAVLTQPALKWPHTAFNASMSLKLLTLRHGVLSPTRQVMLPMSRLMPKSLQLALHHSSGELIVKPKDILNMLKTHGRIFLTTEHTTETTTESQPLWSFSSETYLSLPNKFQLTRNPYLFVITFIFIIF